MLGRVFRLAEGVLFGTAPPPLVRTLRRQPKTESLGTLRVTYWIVKDVIRPASHTGSLLPNR
jgi:hypothetical protein